VPESLHRLIEFQDWGVNLIKKNDPNIPKHDFNVLSMDLPSLFSNIIPNKKYIKADPHPDISSDKKLMGICWESSTQIKNINLSNFKKYSDQYDIFNLNIPIVDQSLLEGCEDFELLGVEINDWMDTAQVIESMDVVVSVDTAVLHLAGAMKKETYGILNENPDARWGNNKKTPWYPTMKLGKIDEIELS